MYYIASEALTNVAKHAEATRATVTIARDGARPALQHRRRRPWRRRPAGGSGLLGLRDRAEAVGGTRPRSSARRDKARRWWPRCRYLRPRGDLGHGSAEGRDRRAPRAAGAARGHRASPALARRLPRRCWSASTASTGRIEAVLAPFAGRSRRAHPLLAQDIAALGGDARTCRLRPGCREVHSVREALGVLYVLEGSTLGGAVIARMVERGLGVSRRLRPAPTTPARWRAFGARRRATARSSAAAVATFEDMEAWLCGETTRCWQPGTPVNLENCHREPIRTPGRHPEPRRAARRRRADARDRPGLRQRRRRSWCRALGSATLAACSAAARSSTSCRSGRGEPTPNLRPCAHPAWLDAFAYRVADRVLVVELEPVGATAAPSLTPTRTRSPAR